MRTNNKSTIYFLILGISSLFSAICFGLIGGIQYVIPTFLKESITFNQIRPLHVTLAISWIILTSIGGIYYYINQEFKIFSRSIIKIHFFLYFIIGITIILSYLNSSFGGKEYLEFPPLLIIPILLGWILMTINYFKSTFANYKNWPVYYWMWATGLVFMIYHLLEAYLWVFPHFENNFIKSLALQWKSGGSFVGCWNMFVYGTAIYLMSKIDKSSPIGKTKKSFFFFFLGFVNLLFGWAHHIYPVPTSTWIRYTSYIISMTEWIILFFMIYEWYKNLSKKIKTKHFYTLKFLMLADFWVFLNILLALLISIPAINFFTHGTHITVAHSMGTTIGINTTILLASLAYISHQLGKNINPILYKYGFNIFNLSLLTFWITLLYAGLKKSIAQNFEANFIFSALHYKLKTTYILMTISGVGIIIGLFLILFPILNFLIKKSEKL